MTREHGHRVALAAAAVIGLAIAWMDSRPGWDDTGITAGCLFIAAAAVAFLAPRRPWLTALAIGLWIPLRGVAVEHQPMFLVVLLIPLLGAYGAAGARLLFARAP